MFTHLSDLDLRLIRVFLAIVDAGGISSAQATLNVGQSTISTQLATLETRLGYRLCERGRGGFALTVARRAVRGGVPRAAGGRRHVRHDRAQRRQETGGNAHDRHHRPHADQSRARASARRSRGFGSATNRCGLPCWCARRANWRNCCWPGGFRLRSAISGIACRRWTMRRSTPRISSRIARAAIRSSSRPATSIPTTPPISNGRGAVIRCRKPNAMTPRNISAVADNMEAVAMLVLSGRHLGYLPGHFAAPYEKEGLLAPLNPATDALPRRVPDGHARRGTLTKRISWRRSSRT